MNEIEYILNGNGKHWDESHEVHCVWTNKHITCRWQFATLILHAWQLSMRLSCSSNGKQCRIYVLSLAFYNQTLTIYSEMHACIHTVCVSRSFWVQERKRERWREKAIFPHYRHFAYEQFLCGLLYERIKQRNSLTCYSR